MEETNGHLFSKKHTMKKCYDILCKEITKQKPSPIYIDSCKYIVYPFKLRTKNYELPLNRFGTLEIHDKQEHSYHWLDEIPNKNIHPRLYELKKFII
mgnify:CR=1 FL=1